MDLTCLKNKDLAIIGHDNADIDSIVSGIMLNKLFRYVGISSRFIITDNIVESKITSILLKYNVNVSDYISTLKEDYLFLVDHNKTNHKGTVLGVIDHHISILENNYPIYINSVSASTSIHIYRIMKDFNYPFSKDDITLILLAAYTDTCSLKSSKVTDLDRKDILNLITKYNINEDVLYKEGFLLRDLSSMTFKDILNNGLKRYTFGETTFNSSYLRIGNIEEAKSIELSLILNVRDYLTKSKDNIDFWIFIFVCINENKTLIININRNAVDTYIKHGVLSRGKDIIPNIEKKYSVQAV